ncbi:TetR/AcrR family transcriptional regulator [Streptacidiphilus sp. ASG 303]|uniref:TetR/AcrR family transcriptional regulator n=1 Tax=Streptacidiphilus sp. ASG 303 TaxID=2896847 RepID=UPI001E2CFD6E|nr:TetR/AcrR family transcriptional regulator [Streptacidiphilus sp. ASG 303]MCD0486000.1 TetR/AcrR family transcriptional regulator [Streptacidiphilus sp. ASG 303]
MEVPAAGVPAEGRAPADPAGGAAAAVPARGVPARGAPTWEPRRLAAVSAVLPEGVTPPGTRGRILEAALSLFAECGFAGGSIRQIAAVVGINSATLYAHYPSKEHVLAALVRIGHEETHTRLADALATSPGGAPQRLAALVRAHVLVHTDHPLLAVVTNDELHALSPGLAAPALELRDACRRMLLDVLERGAREGAFSVPDPVLAATAIGAMGLRVAYWFGPDQPYTREQVADAFADFALRVAGAAR